MAIDPSHFDRTNVVDTCAVWNILRSRRLYDAALSARCHFVITTFVEYECLRKPRRCTRLSDSELVSRLRTEQGKGKFTCQPCGLDDLQVMASLENRKRLGKGEISSIAFAMRFRRAVMTDDQKARRLAAEAGHEAVQTTPHLFSWLVFTQVLAGSDKETVIAQHRELDGVLEDYFEGAYVLALQYRSSASAGRPAS
jgi:hypothetical protein